MLETLDIEWIFDSNICPTEPLSFGKGPQTLVTQNYAPSIESVLRLSHEKLRLDIYPKSLKAVFSAGLNSASIQGEGE